MTEIKWSIDSLCLRGGVIFGHGWIFHPDVEIDVVSVRAAVPSSDDSKELVVDYGKFRPDVAEKYSTNLNARHSGFILLGPCPSDDGRLVLHCRLSSGKEVDLLIPDSVLSRLGESFGARRLTRGLSIFPSLLFRAWSLIRRGQWRCLFSKVNRYIIGRPAKIRDPVVAAVQRIGSMRAAIIIDHDLGGGANKYRDQYIEKRQKQGGASIVYSFHVSTLSLQILVINGDGTQRFVLGDAAALIRLAAKLGIDEIVYNTGVSFPEPEHIPELLVALKQETNARLILTVHDFFMLCPSHFLLNSGGAYCGLPDVSVCKQCLPNNTQGFASLFKSSDISAWRGGWGSAILAADEVRCFSNDSKVHVSKAYPLIEQRKLTMIPHAHYSGVLRSPSPRQTDDLVIGVIGQIGYHKGGRVVADLAEEIRRRRLQIRIVVIGALEYSCNTGVVKQTGGYSPNDLPDLVESNGVRIVLFPSIWPETFSYVVQEVMQMGLPLACFDLGAPAERVKDYANGLILKSSAPSQILSDVLGFLDQGVESK